MKLTPSMITFLKGSLQLLLIILVLALGVAANFYLSSSSSTPSQNAAGLEALLVEVIEPQIVTAPLRVNESGVVQSRNTVGITPQVSGQVIEVSENLASGGVFGANEILFRLDPSDYQADVDQARADVSSARAKLQLEQAEAEIAKREWDLVHPGEPIPDLVAREPQIAQSRATLESAEARLQTAELYLQRVAFSLPFTGRIVNTTVEVGQRLSANQTYGNAYSLDSIEIPVAIDAEVVAALEPIVGRSAVVRRQGRRTSEELAAVVDRVEAELDEATRLLRVILRLDDPLRSIPGTFVNVEIIGPVRNDAFAIPEQAMSEARYVWVAKEGRMEKRSLEFLGLGETGSFIVTPFDSGDGIIISPMSNPTESMPVRIVGDRAAQ